MEFVGDVAGKGGVAGAGFSAHETVNFSSGLGRQSALSTLIQLVECRLQRLSLERRTEKFNGSIAHTVQNKIRIIRSMQGDYRDAHFPHLANKPESDVAICTRVQKAQIG